MTLRITIELVPNGVESRARKLGRIELYNRSDLAAISDYDVSATCETQGNVITHIYRQKRGGGWARLLRAALDQILKDYPRFAEFNG